MGELLEKLNELCEVAGEGVAARWDQLPIELADGEEWEVVGGLLARQATLCTQLAMAPMIWNPHIAPMIIRSMIDCFITLRWVLSDPSKNAKKYVLYGLGRHKLYLNHLRDRARDDPDLHEMLEIEEAWLNNQRGEFATTVDVGNLDAKSTRTMAIEAGCEDLYSFPFSQFSGVVHNMWHHVARFNLEVCDNPLHKYHRVPLMPLSEPDLEWVYQAAKHLTSCFEAVDEHYGLTVEVPLPLDRFFDLFVQDEEDETDTGGSGANDESRGDGDAE